MAAEVTPNWHPNIRFSIRLRSTPLLWAARRTTSMDIIGTITKVQGLLDRLRAVQVGAWKGNDAPNTHHWDEGSIHVSGGLEADQQRAWLQFAFTDGLQAHTIRADFRVTQPGTPGGDDQITLDGLPVSDPDFVISSREGVENWHWYTRVVCEFKFKDASGSQHRYRFDGDLV